MLEGLLYERDQMNLQPLHDRILVQVTKEEITKSGIILMETERPQIGKVIAVGTGRLMSNGVKVPLVVKFDDVVFFSKHAGQDMGDDRYLFREDEILGIVLEG